MVEPPGFTEMGRGREGRPRVLEVADPSLLLSFTPYQQPGAKRYRAICNTTTQPKSKEKEMSPRTENTPYQVTSTNLHIHGWRCAKKGVVLRQSKRHKKCVGESRGGASHVKLRTNACGLHLPTLRHLLLEQCRAMKASF